MSQPLLARIGAVRLLLQGEGGTARHAALSQAQANALATMVARERHSLSGDQKAAAAALISRVNWFGTHDLAVLQSLADPSGSSRKADRSKGHNYMSILNHNTAAGWERLGSSPCGMA